ncbi:catabolic 3-dehydroquinase 1 [Rhizodiscina lignyota]|uniref:Catabolic 3-dehydroquinase n=1 Tax=Rhizodiscina lignyota TaxID=1504668 RepID=A0A9P4M570_9PEZI|nr:catabolic 3-dehydroquinase 1 [Rhizodiscina lignyota]
MRNGKKTVLVINGPNLNLLGTREPHLYGSETLQDVETAGEQQGTELNANVDFHQSNWEGAIIDRIQQARTDGTDGIVINPGGFTHTSVAIRDALLGVSIPFIELHVANIHAREEWRHHSYFSDKAKAIIVGCGAAGYGYAISHVVKKFPERENVS